jgi:hypothetical protein
MTGLMELVVAAVLELYIWILRLPAADAVLVIDTAQIPIQAKINIQLTNIFFKKIPLFFPCLIWVQNYFLFNHHYRLA